MRQHMDFDDEIKDRLGFRTLKKVVDSRSGGCISEGEAYEVDDDRKVWVKKCVKANACQMVVGEFAGLQAIASTATVRVPQPIDTLFAPDASSAVIVMEHLPLDRLKSQEKLGEQLAQLHGHNEHLRQQDESNASRVGHYDNNADAPYVTSFGFETTTCCGSIAMNNEWVDDWESFFARNRLAEQMSLIQENYGDRQCLELWSGLQIVIPLFFKEFHEKGKQIRPSLLHGDLWSGNAAETDNGPAIFDPSAFFGHSEFDLAIGKIFGGFSRSFYNSYWGDKHQRTRAAEQRLDLYQLFHYLNHWNHFGAGYRERSVSLMKRLTDGKLK